MKPLTSILTITGSDSFGATGIQADFKTISELGAYPLSAITSIVTNEGADTIIQDLPQETYDKYATSSSMRNQTPSRLVWYETQRASRLYEMKSSPAAKSFAIQALSPPTEPYWLQKVRWNRSKDT